VYDFYLGGFHNFEVDRAMAREAMRMWPELPQIMQANRAFLRRAVRHVVGLGITQLLDIGSGIPTVGNSHEIARQTNPEARVAYIDVDSVAVAHSRAILAGDTRTTVVRADLREPERIVEDGAVRNLLDLDRPVAILLVAVLHFIADDDDPAALIGRLRDVVPAGSALVISHASREGQPDLADSHQRLYERTPMPMTMRSRDEITAFFNGFDLVSPGVVPMQEWRADKPTDSAEPRLGGVGFAGVGIKPWPR
jgi:hypothetical protein